MLDEQEAAGADPSDARDRISRLRALLQVELRPHPDYRASIEAACVLAVDLLPIAGAAVSLMTASATGAPAASAIVAAANEWSMDVEEVEMTTGEGPACDAFTTSRPVLTSDLARTAQWPGYAPAALALGLRASWAFPLQVGAVRLGVLHLHSQQPRTLTPDQVGICLMLVDAVTATVLEIDLSADRGLDDDPGRSASHDRVYQAQGMIAAAQRVSLTDAMARLRAYAFSHELDLATAAADVVAGTSDLTDASPDPTGG